MSKLVSYIATHAATNNCDCAGCKKKQKFPAVDMIFFKIHVSPNIETRKLKKLILDEGLDLFDGKPHNFVEIGNHIEDLGLALTLMAMGAQAGLWELSTPRTVFETLPDLEAKIMARRGMIEVVCRN